MSSSKSLSGCSISELISEAVIFYMQFILKEQRLFDVNVGFTAMVQCGFLYEASPIYDLTEARCGHGNVNETS